MLYVLCVLTVVAQGKPAPKDDAKHCMLKLVSQPRLSKQNTIRTREGEKSTRLSPLITFEMLESGEVTNARVKRSSGIADVDAHALSWVRSATYNKRPGCGVIDSEASVQIHFH